MVVYIILCLVSIIGFSAPPKRQGVQVKQDLLSNRHYLNQFALLLLQSSIKVGKVRIDDGDGKHTILGHLDGIIGDMIDMLSASRHMSEKSKILRIFTRLFKAGIII